MTERLLTTRQVAEFLGVSTETVLRRRRAGELPCYRLASNVVRFRETEIHEWLSMHTAGPRMTGANRQRAGRELRALLESAAEATHNANLKGPEGERDDAS